MSQETPSAESGNPAKRRRVLRKSAPKVDDLPEATAPLSKYQSFAMARVDRSRIANAPYNPRIIDAHAKRRLLGELKRGMVAPVTWNRRTGNLVGGHQRLSILDDLATGADYSMEVAVIDVDEAEERRLNVALNSPDMQGQYDPTKMAALITEHLALDNRLDVANDYGLDPLTLEAQIGIDPALYLPPEEPKVLEEIDEAGKIKEMKALRRQHKVNQRALDEKNNARMLAIEIPVELSLPAIYERREKILAAFGIDSRQPGPIIAYWRAATRLGIALTPEDSAEALEGDDATDDATDDASA